jgi:polyisoprenoid-binding protein YceI
VAFLASASAPTMGRMQTTNDLPLVPGRWVLDPAHSSVGFAVRHLGVAKVRGRFTDFETDVVVGETLADSSVIAVVQVASVDTGNTDRDAHIQRDDMVDVATRPTITFRSTAIEGGGEDWVIGGEVTIGEVTQPISLAVELGGVQDFVDGTRHAGFEATGELKRTDFGIAPGVPAAMLGDVIKIQLDVELIEPQA